MRMKAQSLYDTDKVLSFTKLQIYSESFLKGYKDEGWVVSICSSFHCWEGVDGLGLALSVRKGASISISVPGPKLC